MKFIVIYLLGALVGFLYRGIQNKFINGKEPALLIKIKPQFLTLDTAYSCKTNSNYKKKKRILPKILILLVFIILVTLSIKYDFIGKIKPIVRKVIDVLKPIMIKILSFVKQAFLFILGLCTPYLSKIATKKLKKIRKKLKKLKKKMKNRKVNNAVSDEDKEEK